MERWRSFILIPMIVLPAFLVGGFEYFRHQLFLDLPMRTGNLLAAAVALVGSLLYYLILYRTVEALVRQAQEERAERIVRDRQAEIAADLHDEVLQNLFLLNVQVGEARERVAKRDLSQVEASLASMQETVWETHDRMRRTIRALEQVERREWAGEARDGKEWFDQLREGIAGWEKETGIPVVADLTALAGVTLPGSQARAVQQVIHQALQNVAKHAAASRVAIGGRRGEDFLELTVRDNGRGFDVEAIEPHFGLRRIRRHGAEPGVSVRIDSEPGQGTCVTIRLRG